VSSRLTYVEVRAALAAARRDRRISARALRRAVATFDAQWEAFEVLDVDGTVAGSAARIAEAFALRSHDAVQLASALHLQDGQLTIIALDNRLRRAAGDAGLGLAP